MNSQSDLTSLIKVLKDGIAVIPTDTLYGIVGSALNPQVVESIYQLRKRDKDKPMIILISSLDDLNLFIIKPDPKTKKILNSIWPNPVSVILPCTDQKFTYLHRGTDSLAFRIPNNEWLINLLQKTGPMVAPSANPEGQKPAETIEEAKQYFGDQVVVYFDQGKLSGDPSTLIKINDGDIEIIREGTYKI